eukprot:269820-Pleurochrysis_carterae.AAC.1
MWKRRAQCSHMLQQPVRGEYLQPASECPDQTRHQSVTQWDIRQKAVVGLDVRQLQLHRQGGT